MLTTEQKSHDITKQLHSRIYEKENSTQKSAITNESNVPVIRTRNSPSTVLNVMRLFVENAKSKTMKSTMSARLKKQANLKKSKSGPWLRA